MGKEIRTGLYITSVWIAAAAASLVSAQIWPTSWEASSFIAMYLMAGGVFLIDRYPIKLSPQADASLFTVALFTGALLMHPLQAAIGGGIGVFLSEALQLRPLKPLVFNVGAGILATALTGITFWTLQALAGNPPLTHVLTLGSAVIAGIVLELSNMLITAGIVTVRKGSEFWEFWKDAWAFETMMQGGTLVLGLVAAILVSISMWAAALLAVPLAIVYTAFRKSVEETRRSAELAERNADLAYDLQDQLEKLEDAQAELIVNSEKLASIGTTAASVVHEVKNVMTNTALRSEMLLKRADLYLKSERAVNYVESIHESTERVNTLVQELLAYSRVDKTPKPVNLQDAMAVAADLVEKRAYKEEVTIHRTFAEAPQVRGISSQLQQVFMNLMMNAIDATPAGGMITLSTRTEGDWVVASVRDTGSGIPDEVQAKIFEPFFTTKEEGKGTGMGMFVCRKIVTDHEGQIEINSRVGLGTEMLVRFKALEQAEVDQNLPAPVEIDKYRSAERADANLALAAVVNHA